MEFVNDFISNVKGDDVKIKKLVDSAKSGRKIEKREPSTVGRALRDFVAYGEQSRFLRRMTVRKIKNTKSIDYIQAFQNALKYELDIFYTGRLSFDSVAASIKKSIPLSDNPIDSQSPHDLEVDNWDEDAVFLVKDKKVVQSQIYFLVNGNPVVESDRPKSNAYNKYFGRGMSSIIFQEIREFRSLAYSAGGGYRTNFYNNKKGYFSGYVGCQADKTLEAISVFKDLALNMPEKPERLEQIRSGLIKSINANRPSFRSFPSRVSNWIKQGYRDDPRKEQVSFYENMSFDDIVNFQKDNIAGRPMVITLLTDTKQVNTIELIQFGKVIMLKKKDILN
jgi:predicted Zn-dependent peptidase